MSNPLMKYIAKALLTVGAIIVDQIAEYVSSERFKSQAKASMKSVVEKMVDLVIKEKNQII